MPTTYTPDPTVPQLPSPVPAPENYPLLQIPIATEGRTVSSIQQFVKALGDHIAWLKRPRAVDVLFPQQWIMAFRTLIGHKRFVVDHLGFPGGQLIAKDVVWLNGPSAGVSGSGDQQITTMPEWRYRCLDTSPGTGNVVFGVFQGTACTPMIQIQAAATNGDYTVLSSGPYGSFTANNHVAFDVLAGIQTGHASLEAVVGLGSYGGNDPTAGLPEFIGFVRRAGTNWLCITRNAGTETATDSGVAPTDPLVSLTLDRLRVEWSGENVADDVLRRVRFYVNGSLVQTHSTNLPLLGAARMVFGQQNVTGTPNSAVLYVGSARYRANIFPADVAQ
jgi:hypothetical protein